MIQPPLRKGQRTRADIVRRSAELMNRHGFLAAPVAAVVEATGIQKGGLYRHFESREALAFEALDHAVAQVRERLLGAMQRERNACDQLLAMLRAYDGDSVDVPLPGGCPIMNCAIEADHAHPGLRERAQTAMSAWHGLIVRIVTAGVRRGEIRAGTDPQQTASAFIAGIEGGVMLTQLYADARHLRAARALLEDHIAHRLRPQPRPGENR
jgi:TetR/AcrR family transcriptional regulator, transcriptional repressor for nem operon